MYKYSMIVLLCGAQYLCALEQTRNITDTTRTIRVVDGPKVEGASSQAKLFIQGNIVTLYTSAQLPIDPKDKTVYRDIVTGTHQVMCNFAALLRGASMDFNNVLKVTIYLADLRDTERMYDIYSLYFQDHNQLPAVDIVHVASLPHGVKVQMSLVASKEA